MIGSFVTTSSLRVTNLGAANTQVAINAIINAYVIFVNKLFYIFNLISQII